MLLRHSGGVLVLASRGYGTFVSLSSDGGAGWSPRWRVSPASAMTGMVELGNGTILLVMHEGYRLPGLVRAQRLRLTPGGVEPAEVTP